MNSGSYYFPRKRVRTGSKSSKLPQKNTLDEAAALGFLANISDEC